ncbi:hypothetical protein [Chloroflexus sp.]|uniref:hypothetical protein n=1 Tax=Chloroflexus sp. TaxID=1904827 RepID=UPI00404A3DEE
MAIDPSGNLWVTDPINGIVRLSTTGAIAQQWTIPDERFNDMAIAPNGQLYLTSYTNKVWYLTQHAVQLDHGADQAGIVMLSER